MADARQKEINVSITEVATKTLIAGRCRLLAGDDIEGIKCSRIFGQVSSSLSCKGKTSVYRYTDVIRGVVRATLVGPA